jgi:hypothetical protein
VSLETLRCSCYLPTEYTVGHAGLSGVIDGAIDMKLILSRVVPALSMLTPQKMEKKHAIAILSRLKLRSRRSTPSWTCGDQNQTIFEVS